MSSTDTCLCIFVTPAEKQLFKKLKKKRSHQEQFLKRVFAALTDPVPRTYVEDPYRGAKAIEHFRAGDQMRGYCVFEESPPGHTFFLFICVTQHEYSKHEIAKYDPRAVDLQNEMRALQTEAEAKQYADEIKALDSDDIAEIMTEMGFDDPRENNR